MQNLIYQQGNFTFSDGRKDEGMVISRYNIKEARVEFYFIPAKNLLAFESARSHHDLEAHKKWVNWWTYNRSLLPLRFTEIHSHATFEHFQPTVSGFLYPAVRLHHLEGAA